jgi:hypothetical protein
MPYLNLDDGYSEHRKVDALSDAAFRQLTRDICEWSKTGRTENPLVLEFLANRMIRRAPRHWLPEALQPLLRRHRRKIPTDVRELVLARDGHACHHCASRENLTLDHIVPWSMGGTDDESNLQTLCQPCNSRKGARV